jgi:hypothetical protein
MLSRRPRNGFDQYVRPIKPDVKPAPTVPARAITSLMPPGWCRCSLNMREGDRAAAIHSHPGCLRLEAGNLVQRIPGPVGEGVQYTLTDRGRALGPALAMFRQWGLDELLPPACAAGEPAVYDLSYAVPAHAGLRETYEWRIDQDAYLLDIDGTCLTVTPGPPSLDDRPPGPRRQRQPQLAVITDAVLSRRAEDLELRGDRHHRAGGNYRRRQHGGK